MTKPQDDFIKTAIRLPRDLHAAILDSAAQHGRSMNAEMLARLANQSGVTLSDIAAQNVHTQEMVQMIIDTINPHPSRSGT